ncbi:plasmid segregation protein ParM domain-containing protein [Acerihabitans sp. TG2]|uniref:plasmid segregation protein ParM domain-containing protein n=1 Tax=Acerihabitans sp. TG2 TaxID=3096008 RepID=UPI002B22EB2D|nr:plasmid segregation protein ParM domain-containing protein [Acerihabitans sp. TG2]MEA9392660.1 plasmid segregation protein ParM domain-containing protein [Acerihabitans sp. TG2]
MKKISCDDGSTNVKLAWLDGDQVCTSISPNSFRAGWKVAGIGSRETFNYDIDGLKYTFDDVSQQAISTTNIEYQYGDTNLLAVHHALLNSGLPPQTVSLTVTLPISEFYTDDCQHNETNIKRKIDNLLRPVTLNKGNVFTITAVDVMPESLPAVISQLSKAEVGPLETSLVIDLGGTTLDAGVLVGQFEDVSAIQGNSSIGVSMVTQAALTALRMANSDTSPFVADQLIQRRHDRDFVATVVNDQAKVDYVLDMISSAIDRLGERVVNELSAHRHVNRVWLVGGGAPLIEAAVRRAWKLAPDRIVVVGEPQTALVRELVLL